jgi:CHASE1-domain containing sensor protein
MRRADAGNVTPLKRFFPAAIFLSVALASLVTAWAAYVGVEEAARLKFEATADDALNRIESSVDLNLSLLTATRAFFMTHGADVSQAEFNQYYDALNADANFPGLRGIGYVRLMRTGSEAEAEREILRLQGIARHIYPETDQAWRAPIMMFEPLDPGNLDAIGFDMFTDPSRRAALEAALESGEPRATTRVVLGKATANVQTYPGFLAFARIDVMPAAQGGGTAKPEPAGFLYAAFRAGALFNTALGKSPLLPVNVEVYDTLVDPGNLLFRSEARPDASLGDALAVTRQATVGGRTWQVIFRPTSTFAPPTSLSIVYLIVAAGLLFAAAIAYVVRLQARAHATETTLRMSVEKSLKERDMMLQEMKHRIKNSIAKMLAIARHTAANSGSLQEFTASFMARMQAMAASQDMLTRSQWQRADLGKLLRTELEQVFGPNIEKLHLSGPQIELNETATQALGLTFHELATNALKYGEAGNDGGTLGVEWEVRRAGKQRSLALTWSERGQSGFGPPSRSGFGTKLIDMTITRELGGTIMRDFQHDELRIDIEIPLVD